MFYNRKSRRQFLIGTGGTFLAMPFLPSMMPKAMAAPIPAKRFLCIAQDNGRSANQWYPNSNEAAKLQAVSGVPYMRDMPMRNIAGNISQVFGDQFNGAIRDKLLLIRGLDCLFRNTRGHEMSSILGGNLGGNRVSGYLADKNGPTIDYVMAKNLKSNPQANDPRSYLNLRIENGWDMSYRYNQATNEMIIADRYASPRDAFNFIFGNGPVVTNAPGADRNQKVVDLVLQDYKSVITSAKIAREDKNVLQEHIDSLNQLQTSIINTTQPQIACTGPTGLGGEPIYDNSYDTDRAVKQHMDLMIAAMKCGVTNIGTITLSKASDNMIFNNLGLPEVWHNVYAHNTMESSQILRITQHYASYFSYIINQLNVPEPGTNGTFLDNSLVYYANAMGNGTGHNYDDMAVMLAGGLGGRINTGRYINYANGTQGRNYNSFLVAILQAMGLSQPDYQQPNVAEGFGSDSLWGYGETNGVYEPWRAERKFPTPGLLY